MSAREPINSNGSRGGTQGKYTRESMKGKSGTKPTCAAKKKKKMAASVTKNKAAKEGDTETGEAVRSWLRPRFSPKKGPTRALNNEN